MPTRLLFGRLASGVHGPVALVEVLRAVGADVPLGPDELGARGAHPLETRAARRAEDEVLLHAFLTGGTDDALLRLREETFRRQLTLVRLTERLFRTDDEIQEQAEDVEHDDEKPGEVRKDRILGALLRIADGPEDHREIEREDVKADAAKRELDERVVDEPGPHSTNVGHCLDLRPESLRIATHALPPVIEQIDECLLERDLRLPSGRALEF